MAVSWAGAPLYIWETDTDDDDDDTPAESREEEKKAHVKPPPCESRAFTGFYNGVERVLRCMQRL